MEIYARCYYYSTIYDISASSAYQGAVDLVTSYGQKIYNDTISCIGIMVQQSSQVSRRTFLTGTVGGLAGLGVLGQIVSPEIAHAQPSATDGWTQYNANAGNTARLKNGVGPTRNLKKAWTNDDFRTTDGVAVVDGTVYLGLTARNATDGTERWSVDPTVPDRDYPETVNADVEYPAVMNGTVYATVRFGVYDGDDAYDSAVIAVDANTGTKRWRVDTSPGEGGDRMFSPVTVVDGTIFTSGPAIDGGSGTWLYAFDAADGSVRWRRRRSDGSEWALPVADGRVYTMKRNGVQALDTKTGETVWEALSRVSFERTTSPMVADGTLFVAEENEPGVTLIALDATTGEEHWRTAYTRDSPGITIGTVDSETIYISTKVGTKGSDVIALSLSDGSERWRATIPQPPNRDVSQAKRVPTDGMARVGGLLYVGGAALRPADGTVVWTWAVPMPLKFERELSAVAGGRVYLGGGELTVLSGLPTRHHRQRHQRHRRQRFKPVRPRQPTPQPRLQRQRQHQLHHHPRLVQRRRQRPRPRLRQQQRLRARLPQWLSNRLRRRLTGRASAY